MRHASLADIACPVARTLDVVGEWWTLLIVRDALSGARRFDDFKKRSDIADNILSLRLRRLVESGVLERRRYQTRPDRYEYLLTDKGRALLPVIAALRNWGQHWTDGRDLSPRLLHRTCGHEVSVSFHCDECGRELGTDEVRAELSAGDPLAAAV